jgi:hypothetical protein
VIRNFRSFPEFAYQPGSSPGKSRNRKLGKSTLPVTTYPLTIGSIRHAERASHRLNATWREFGPHFRGLVFFVNTA